MAGVRARALLIAAVFALAACGAGSTSTSDGTASAPDGAAVYAKSGCASCHRLNGPGAGGPGTDLTHVGSRHSARELRAILEKPPPGMPSYGRRLSSEELDALARHLAAAR